MKETWKSNEDVAFKAEVVKDQVQNYGGASGSKKEANRSDESALDSGYLLPVASEETDKDHISQPTTVESTIGDQTSTLESDISAVGKD